MISAKKSGLTRGTMISRGVRALRANRRRDNVSSALMLLGPLGVAGMMARGGAAVVRMADMASVPSFEWRSGGEAIAGEA